MSADRDSWNLWFAAIALPLVIGGGLHQVFGVPGWIGVPLAFLVIDGGGWWLYRRWEQAIERDNTPVAELEDPVFGRLERYPGKNQWENYLSFPPVADEISVSVHADEAGPNENQRQLYRQIVDRYSELFPEIEAKLRECAEFVGETDVRSFNLTSIDIESAPGAWTLAYHRSDNDDCCGFTYFVDVKDWHLGEVCPVH